MQLQIRIWLLLVVCMTQSPAYAQSMDMQQMQNALNSMDPSPPMQPVAPNAVQGQFSYPAQQQYPYIAQPQSNFSAQPLAGYPTTQAPIRPQAPVSPLRALFGGPAKTAPPPKPVSPLQYVMQQFLGGSAGTSSSGASSGNDQQKLYNAREYLQTANDQASRAYNACQRASYGSDKYAKKQAAEEAYYAAQAAHYAANNATAAAAGGSSAANDAAAQARDAADRAQASADQASSNANGGW